MIKIVKDELTELMGSSSQEISLNSKPSIILMSGLQGSGKTTLSAKIAYYLKKKKSKKPLLVACDVYRPAAIEQLEILGKQIDIDVYKNIDEKNPVVISKEAVLHAKKNNFDTVIIDTAGRLAIDKIMMDEISSIHKATNPDETLFVVDSMTGQDAVNSAKAFNEV
jgi:signal recognition particle subunit SRP54